MLTNHDAQPLNLSLDEGLWEQMRDDVSRLFPQEACGLLGGSQIENQYLAKIIFPIENILHSRVKFQMNPNQQLHAIEEIESQNLALVAIYHSHPNGPAWPSPTDVAETFYPDVLHLIWFMYAEEWKCQGYLIQAGNVSQVPINVIHLRGTIN